MGKSLSARDDADRNTLGLGLGFDILFRKSSFMHRSIGNIIADTLELSLGYSERLLSGISPERFSRFADVGGVIIHSNHPCFIYGHLSLYAPRVTEQLGQSAIAVSDRFSKVFSKDSICVDDPSSDYYPPFMEVISFFRDSYRQSVAALRASSDSLLDQPNPSAGRMAELFPTLGSLHNFYCGGHIMSHLGQLSAWRRMERLGSV